MPEATWAQDIIEWLLTPTLITGALLGLARLYDPPTRWARRLRSDSAILGGLPEGAEKAAWQESFEGRARRLREYQLAFVGWTLFWKWFVVLAVGATVFGLVLYPPINKPGEPPDWGAFDYGMIFLGLYSAAIYVVSVSAGRDFLGRSPRAILLLRRLGRYNRRLRKLRRIDKIRLELAEKGWAGKQKGSRRGFDTQLDKLGSWMRDEDLRGYVRNAGFVSADIQGRYLRDLRRRGVALPEWPEPEVPTPALAPESSPIATRASTPTLPSTPSSGKRWYSRLAAHCVRAAKRLRAR